MERQNNVFMKGIATREEYRKGNDKVEYWHIFKCYIGTYNTLISLDCKQNFKK
jgi:hypothetical protein